MNRGIIQVTLTLTECRGCFMATQIGLPKVLPGFGWSATELVRENPSVFPLPDKTVSFLVEDFKSAAYVIFPHPSTSINRTKTRSSQWTASKSRTVTVSLSRHRWERTDPSRLLANQAPTNYEVTVSSLVSLIEKSVAVRST